MGLDMYLTARRYVSEHTDKELFDELQKVDVPNKGPMEVKGIEFEAMYWRKANAIHKWFVDNVQKGVDDCDSYYVEKDKLEDLIEVCRQILENRSKAQELLPAQNGFFFGSADYDEYYFEYVQRTHDRLQEVIKAVKSDDGWNWSFFYQSSW
jgi:hypothetical protein